MAKYKYQAVAANGKKIRGVMTASDETELYEKLKTEGCYLISAKEQMIKHHMPVLKARQTADFCREIGTLLGAGVPLTRALDIIAKEETLKPREQMIYSEVLRILRQGKVLSEALTEQGSFPIMLIQMFRAAETAGNLDQTAQRMAGHYEKEHRLNARIKSSTIYPRFLCGMMAVVVIILISYVLPQFESLFFMMEELPLSTRMLYGISGWMVKYWPVFIIGSVAGLFLIQGLCGIRAVGLQIDKIKLSVPVIGKQLKIIYTARFARSLSSLYGAGISIVTAIQIARKTVGNTWIDKQFDEAVTSLQRGDSLSDAIVSIDGFNKKLAFSVKIGEETGSLETMLNSTADGLEYESEVALNKIAACVEPALIVVLALIVGFIMIAVITPIYASYNAIGGSAYN